MIGKTSTKTSIIYHKLHNIKIMQYNIQPSNRYNNSIEISLAIPAEHMQNGISLYMPCYIAGSYMIRDFAKHIINIKAYDSLNHEIFIHKPNISKWYIDKINSDVMVTYTLYAADRSVRGNYCDDERIQINGAASFIYAEEFKNKPLQIKVNIQNNYRVFTTLAQNPDNLIYNAKNFEELCDTPIIILKDNHYLTNQKCDKKEYKIVFSGDVPHNIDINKINEDIHTICNEQDKFFGCENEYKTHLNEIENNDICSALQKNIDYKYLFITHVAQDSYGGLEHKASTVLACGPENLYINNCTNKDKINEKYIEFLGLCSHEYFHSWWVKRVKPQSFIDVDFQQEFDTSLLWIFEGFTSYYDDLFLYKAKIINKQKYINLIEKNLNAIYKYQGHYEQSLYEASADAWIKHYQPNENSHNANISYYIKGTIIALCLDLHIRIHSDNKSSLDDVIIFMFNKYGRNFYNSKDKKGICYNSFIQDIQISTGLDLKSVLYSWIFNTDLIQELPFIEYLQHFGVNCIKNIEYKTDWGIQYDKNQTFIILDKVNMHGLAYKAGFMAGDILISINNIMILPKNADEIFERIDKSEDLLLHYIKNRQLKQIMIKCNDRQCLKFSLTIDMNCNLENTWLC